MYAVGLEGGVNKTVYPRGSAEAAVAMTCFAWMAAWKVGSEEWGMLG